jgi:hypothetical protein
MALRILSGMIFIPRCGTRSGSVTVGFLPFALTAASNNTFELRRQREIGPKERFRARPAFVVGARQFGIVSIVGGGGYYRMNIDDVTTRDSITIRWKARGDGRVDQEEISFMVIGEVPDRVRVTLPPRSVTTPTGTGRRPSARSATSRGRRQGK